MVGLNKYSIVLGIELNEKKRKVGQNLYNEKASATAKIKKMWLDVEVYEENDQYPHKDLFRDPTKTEWNEIVYDKPEIVLKDWRGNVVMKHRAKNGKNFTLRDMKNAILKTERKSRPKSEWLGGIDCHHIFLDGIGEDGSIHWGS